MCKEADVLLEKLGGLPLALIQAAAYIQQTNMSVDTYVGHYNQRWDTHMAYQDRYPLQEYAERSVLTTWKLSYNQVQSIKPEAARFLDQSAFLDPGDMSWELMETYMQSDKKGESAEEEQVSFATNKLSFQDSIGVLAQYLLVNATVNKGTLSIRPVVHDWTLYNIGDQRTERLLCARAIRIIAKRIPPFRVPDQRAIAQVVLPHARTVATRLGKIRVTGLEHELHVIAYFMKEWGSSRAVETMYMRALEGYEEAWGLQHPSTLAAVSNLGMLYAVQGKMKDAEEMYIRALEGKEAAWGAKHTSTFDTVNNLASLYSEQGKTKQAEKMYLRALGGYEEAWGAQHTSTLVTVNNLGAIYRVQGRTVEAEDMYLRAPDGYEGAWETKHALTLDTFNNLGVLYSDQGKTEKVEKMFVRAVEGYEEVWGAKQTSTLDTVNNLGGLYKDQGKLEQAENCICGR